MGTFDLDTTLIDLHGETQDGIWTVRDAVEGVQIFGGIGSGKTSGSGRMIALKFLKAGFGGLVLTVKPDERAGLRGLFALRVQTSVPKRIACVRLASPLCVGCRF